MGERGPKKKPSAIKKRNGTYKKSRDLDPVSDTPGLVIPWVDTMMNAPKHFNQPAKEEWIRIMNFGISMNKSFGYLTEFDLSALKHHCFNYGQMVEMEKKMDDSLRRGHMALYEETAKIYTKLSAIYLRTSARFGLSPSDRRTIQLNPIGTTQEKDPYNGKKL